MGALEKGASGGGPTLEYFVLKRTTRETATLTFLQHESLTFDESKTFLDYRRWTPVGAKARSVASKTADQEFTTRAKMDIGTAKMGIERAYVTINSFKAVHLGTNVLAGSCRRFRRGQLYIGSSCAHTQEEGQ